jgi:hypothetical protein
MGEVLRNICPQARGCFQPVVDVMAGQAAALLIEMKGVVTNRIFAGFLESCIMSGR